MAGEREEGRGRGEAERPVGVGQLRVSQAVLRTLASFSFLFIYLSFLGFIEV